MEKRVTAEQLAQRMIREALDSYRSLAREKPIEPRPRPIASSDYHKKLKPADVNDGVLAFVLLNGMGGGSLGDVDLYTLLKAYLLDPEKRAALNTLVK